MQRQLATGLSTRGVNTIRQAFRNGVSDLNDFHVEAVRTTSATAEMTKALTKNEVSLRQSIKSRKLFSEILREQYMLQKAVTVQWSQNAMGQTRADMVVPRGVSQNIDRMTNSLRANLSALRLSNRGTEEYSAAARILSTRIALVNTALASGSHMMINWGKNTQWAGRQLMVGFTVPFAAFGALAGAAAYQVDKELTRITKVYDTTAKDAAGKAAELNKVRTESMQVGVEVAKRYGAALKDTLSVEADLAAAGMKGQDLTSGAAEVVRAATLGEMDYQQTVKATIALQSIYGHSTKKLGEDFDYMNSLENATNLSMQDMVEAIPRAAGTLHQMGVSFQEMGVMMAAMKGAGIEAAQGANALKSGMNRVLNPSKKVTDQLAGLGINIKKIVTESKGDLFKILQQLSEKMQGMDRVTKGRALGALFGTMQMNRITAIVNAMDDLHDITTQVGRAYQVSQQSAEKWGATAAGEMNRVQESASGKFKRAIETLKAELATVGEPFLKIGTTVIGWITDIIGAFNKMPDAAKTGLAALMIITAIAGPVIMVTGLVANLTGQFLKYTGAAASFLSRTRIMTAEQRAQQMMSERSSRAWANQANAAQALAGQLNILTEALDRVAVAQTSATTGITSFRNTTPNTTGAIIGGIGPAAPPTTSPYAQNSAGRYYNTSTGRLVSAREAQAYAAAQAAAARSQQQGAVAAASTRRSFTGIASSVAGIALLGGMMATASGHASKMLNTMVNIALAAAMIGPTLVAGFKKAAAAGALADVVSAFGAGRGAAAASGAGRFGSIARGLTSAIGPARVLLTTFLRFAGIAGVVATIGITIAHMVGTMNKMTQAQRNIEGSAKNWADVLGFVYKESANITKESNKTTANYDLIASKLRESNADVAEYLRSLKKAGKDQQLLNAAIYEGIKARTHGASAAQAYTAVAGALRAAGYKTNEIEDKMKEIHVKIKFDVEDSVIKNQGKEWATKFAQVADNTLGQSPWEGFVRMFSGRDEINNKSREAAQGMAKQFWDTFEGTTDMQDRLKIFGSLEKAISKKQKDMWAKLGKENKQELKEFGITNADELQTAYLDMSNISTEAFNKKYGGAGAAQSLARVLRTGLGSDTAIMVGKQAGAERELARAIAEKNGVTGKELDNIYTLKQVMPQLDMATMTSAQAQKAYQNAVGQRELQWQKLSPKSREEQQLQLLNIYRMQAGLSKATSVEQGFGNAVDGNTGKLKDNSAALAENAMSADDFNNARKEAMSNASSAAFSKADEIWNQQADAQVKAIEDRGQRLTDALDKRQDKMDDAFDKRQDSAEKRFDRREKSLDNKWDGIMDRFDNRWERRIKKEKDAYDQRIKNIQDEIKAEQDAEDERQKLFDAEKTRMEHLASIANSRIDFNMALNTGNLDEAAKVFNDIQATQDSWTLDQASQSSADASKSRIDVLNGKVSNLETSRDNAIAHLQKVQEAEKKALEKKKEREKEALQAERDRYMKALQAERERYRKGIEAQKAAIQKQAQLDAEAKRKELDRQKETLDLELAAIRASTPRNKKEYDHQIAEIEGAYKKYGVRLEGYGKDWTDYIGKYLRANVKASANSLDNDIKWKSIGNQVTQEMVDGGFNLSTSEFMKWVTTGQLPKHYKAPHKPKTRHTGGPVSGSSKYDNRGGRNWGTGIRRDESFALLKNDEFVMNGKAHKALGTRLLDQVNKTGVLPNDGNGRGTGGIGGLGLTGVFAAAIAGMASKAIQSAVEMAGAAASMMGGTALPGAAGLYGNVYLTAEQLKNAATIMSVGKSMGATTRDLMIGIMTAMQESGLRNLNYGDRDSLGLFQQRPSQGWGTPEQIRTPSYAARKFFEQELKVPHRSEMAPTLVAQAVQRSAFPYAYAKWQAMAQQVVNSTKWQNLSAFLKGGKIRPVNGPVSRDWYHHSNLPRATDFGVPVGTPVRAATNGVVSVSRDLKGAGSGGYRSYGRYIVITNGGEKTLYAHLSHRNVGAGGYVRAGQLIGYSGNTGNTTGPHLHFETWMNGVDVPPGRFGIPGLKTGGFTLSDGYAMLHKNETVLTAPLTEQLKTGIQKIDQGVNNDYNVTIDLRGATIREDVDIEKAINKAIDARESKLGRRRSIR